MNLSKYSNNKKPFEQKGIATVLLVLLVGVALSATALGIMHSVRSTQEKQVAVHAATHAQSGVWAGAEAFRRYLATIDEDALNALALTPDAVYPIEFGAAGSNQYGSLTARNVEVTSVAGGKYRVSAQISNIHGAAKSSSALSVMYEIGSDGDCPSCIELSAALDFHDDLVAGGQIDFLNPSGTASTINVDGSVDMLNISTTGIGRLNASGDVTLASNVNIDHIYTNGNVVLDGSARAEKVEARGTVTTIDGAGAGIVWANGTVRLGGSSPSTAANSRSSITATMGAHGTLKAGGDITINGSASGTYGDIMSAGDILISNGITVGDVVGEGTLTCPSVNWPTVDSINIKGELLSPCSNALVASGKAVEKDLSVTVPVMAEVQPFTMPSLVVDVWALKSKANYVFEWDAAVQRTKVTVYNINGETDGTVYHIGDYETNWNAPVGDPLGQPRKSHLCSSFKSPSGDGNGEVCDTPAVPKLAACLGHDVNNSCISYDVANREWTFDGTSAAPGIMWFDGNVYLNNGRNYTTVLATGNVRTGGQFRGVAVNYSGFEYICSFEGTAAGQTFPTTEMSELNSTYVDRFADNYPTNLCDMSSTPPTYTSTPTGNIAIAAGGFDPNGANTFTGGDIVLAANTQVYGTILAGGYLDTGGGTHIYGYISAAVQGGQGADKNDLGGSTTVHLDQLPDSFKPQMVPDMGVPDCVTGCPPEDDNGETSKLLWSKYL